MNLVANEAFLDTAQIRKNIVSHAKLINYVPMSMRGAEAQINVVITPGAQEDQDVAYITLDKWTNFLGADKDQVNYPFVAMHSNTAYKSNGSFVFSNVVVKQGEVVTLQFPVYANNSSRRFQIPSANVDTSTLTISVQQSSSNSTTTEYTLASDITQVLANSTVYFLEEDQNSYYTVYFGDDYIGQKPANDSIVIATYVDTVGPKGNNIVRMGLSDADGIAGFKSNVKITVTSASAGGSDKETIEQVRFRASNYYTSQNRAEIGRAHV